MAGHRVAYLRNGCLLLHGTHPPPPSPTSETCEVHPTRPRWPQSNAGFIELPWQQHAEVYETSLGSLGISAWVGFSHAWTARVSKERNITLTHGTHRCSYSFFTYVAMSFVFLCNSTASAHTCIARTSRQRASVMAMESAWWFHTSSSVRCRTQTQTALILQGSSLLSQPRVHVKPMTSPHS